MRLGFKYFDIGKRKFCITAYRFLEFSHKYIIKEDGTEEKTQRKYLDVFRFNLLPIVKYKYSRSTKELYLGWLFWMICIEDETYQNMGCLL